MSTNYKTLEEMYQDLGVLGYARIEYHLEGDCNTSIVERAQVIAPGSTYDRPEEKFVTTDLGLVSRRDFHGSYDVVIEDAVYVDKW